MYPHLNFFELPSKKQGGCYEASRLGASVLWRERSMMLAQRLHFTGLQSMYWLVQLLVFMLWFKFLLGLKRFFFFSNQFNFNFFFGLLFIVTI